MSRPRHVLLVVLTLVFLLPAGAGVRAGACWRPPVDAPVRDPFRQPACRWCPGNRGIEYGTSSGAPVSAVATGRVSFVGTVAGTRYVVVRHTGGVRVTYGNVDTDRVKRGAVVIGGMRIGTAVGRFHFGVRVGDRYIDPAPLIGRWVFTPRLIPIDGSTASAGRPPRLRC
jgi:murein DD-endopeptidase MepM/ murein hydrolase activator NlpD